MAKYKRINITIPGAVSEELDAISKELNYKKSHIIVEALELYLDKLDLEVAEKRLAEFENSKTEMISAEKIWKDLGID